MAADESVGKQKRLAAKSGIDQSYISKLLKLKASASIETLDALARAFRCQPWELLVDDEAIREEAVRRILSREPQGQ